MSRQDRYQALRNAVRRHGLACLAGRVSVRTIDHADALGFAWERIGRLVYPMDGDYPVR
jgi:hypothetical protein